jgi:hypothetical protein
MFEGLGFGRLMKAQTEAMTCHDLGLGAWGLGLRVEGLGFRV